MCNTGIIVNVTKDKNLEITRSIVKWIESRSGNIMLSPEISHQIGKPQYSHKVNDIYKSADFIIVLGGDGTILGVARDVAEYETPLLGVNLGHLGFLAEVEVKDIFKSLETAFNGNVNIEKRIMLKASVLKNDNSMSYCALNDIAITRGTLSRIITLKIFINDDYVTTINGDGLIIASPTGSTGYSLSAGGPIISPNLSVLTITPICPHSLSTRSMVISDKETIRIDLSENHGDAYFTIDGQEGYEIGKSQQVLVEKAPFTTNLVKLLDRSFYDVLRTKLSEV